MKSYDLAIIGGGIAGLSAAIYARRFELNVILFDAFVGGTLVKTGHIENYPGFKTIQGAELAEKVKEQAMHYKPEIVNENGVEIYPNPASDYFYLKIKNSINTEYNIQIFDVLGRIVYNQYENLISPLKINVENLQNGIYYIDIKQKNKRIISKKLFINN